MYAGALLSLSLLSLLPSLGAAAPTVGAVSMAAAENWTITSLSRTCEEDLSKCTWKFGILRATDSPTPAPTPTPIPTSTSAAAPDATESDSNNNNNNNNNNKKRNEKMRRAEETPCEHVLEALEDGTPATQIRGSGPSECGAFTVTSGWSDAGGPGREFTTISVVDYAEGLIVYPSYLDSLVAEGKVVEPDLSFPAQLIPAY
ncbi:hypothetical protein SLS62_002078 [Diatrype stigma]|uniref:Uncharacterized protein n=1 Tax=Diatrype stigma TaxID=117547 RepID=A0AAN9YR23_9PEZI